MTEPIGWEEAKRTGDQEGNDMHVRHHSFPARHPLAITSHLRNYNGEVKEVDLATIEKAPIPDLWV